MDFLFKIFTMLVSIYQWWSRFYRQYGVWGMLLIIISISAIVVGLVVSYRFYETLQPYLRIAEPGDELDINATGMIGDFIGGVVGPILSFVGVLLFFLALRLQSKELRLQIKELAETRSVFTTQQFENTFFNLLQTQQEIRMSLEVEEETVRKEFDEYRTSYFNYGTKSTKSAAFFELAKNEMFRLHAHLLYYQGIFNNDSVLEALSDDEKKKKQKHIADLQEFAGISDYTLLNSPTNIPKIVYKLIFSEYGNQLGHYFRNLYHILSFIKENETHELHQARRNKTNATRHIKDSSLVFYLNKKQARALVMEERKIKRRHKKYAAFVQAQMSSAELFLVFYNALFFPKMKALIHHYNFLENLNIDDLLNPGRDKKLYKEYVFNGMNYKAVDLKSRDELLKIE